jgi:5S rRNA maturation endonuclease (ribonuclease M5)
MRPSTLRALNRAAELTRRNRLTEALLIAEPVILTADEYEGEEIRRWLLEHVADFTGENHDEPKELP